MKIYSLLTGFFVAGTLLVGGMAPVQAVTTTWTSGASPTSKDWSNPLNWDTGAVPTAADDVVIPGGVGVGTVSTTAPISFKTLTVGSFFYLNHPIVSGGDLTINNNFFQNISSTINLTGKLTVNGTLGTSIPASSFNNGDSRGILFNANEIDVQNGAIVDANYKGYAGNISVGSGDSPSDGAGGNIASAGRYSGAAGYGGGGANYGLGGSSNAGGGTCGGTGCGGVIRTCDLPNLSYAGSGGGGGGGSGFGGQGGNGGGRIILNAVNTTTINGTVRADGDLASGGTKGGGGAGGTIKISGRIIAGTPTVITAKGGSGGTAGGGGGGGGCIMFAYQQSMSFMSTIATVNGGSGGTGATAGGSGLAAAVVLPEMPTNFGVSLSTSTAYLTWTVGGSGSFTNIEISTNSVSYSRVATTTIASTNTTITGLTPATYYYFRIASVSSTIGTSSYAYNESPTVPLDFPAPTLSNVTSNTIGVMLNIGANPMSSNLYVEVVATSTFGNQRFTSAGVPGGSILLTGFYPVTSWSNSISGLVPSTTYYIYGRASFATTPGSNVVSLADPLYSAATTTLLATPGTPSFLGETSTTLNITWSQNGNPTTTPYAVYNTTLNQYHLADGTLSATPTFYPLSSWNGKAKGLTPATLYNFKIVMRNENGTQNATSTAAGNYTLTATGGAFSLGGGPLMSTTTPTGSNTSTTGTAWYFGTPTTPPSTGGSTTSSTTPPSTTPTPVLPTPGTSAYYLP